MAGDPRFFARTGPHALQTIASAAGGAVCGACDTLFTGIAPLQTAGATEVSFLDNRKYLPELAATQAGAVIVGQDFAAAVPAHVQAIVVEAPYLAWARVAALFHPAPPATPGIHPTASVAPDARIDPSAEIGAFVQVGAGAEIGARVRIAAHAAIGPGVVIGPDCRIGPHASLACAILGARVTLLAGARIGEEGFGFATGPEGFVSVPQLGRVVIGDDCHIGANTTIDRGSAQDTVIGAGSRIDNLVQIGHNVRLGRCCVIVAQVGISGSTVLGDFVMAGGQAGLTGHLQIGNGVQIGAQSGVMNDVKPGERIFGSPARPVKEAMRAIAWLYKQAGKRSRQD